MISAEPFMLLSSPFPQLPVLRAWLRGSTLTTPSPSLSAICGTGNPLAYLRVTLSPRVLLLGPRGLGKRTIGIIHY